MFEPVSQPVLVTFIPTRGQKVCSLSAISSRNIHTHFIHSTLLHLLFQDIWNGPYELNDKAL